jgi:hypothetical protein
MRRIAATIMTALLLLPSAAGAETQHVIKSVIFPGWGQFSTGRYTRGSVMMGTALLSLGAIGGLTLQYNRHVDSYDDAAKGFMQADYIGDASEYYDEMTKSWNDADDAYTYRNIAIGVLVGMYAWSILDMAFGPEASVPPVTLEIERDGFRVAGSYSF